jgi:hypothetical protein
LLALTAKSRRGFGSSDGNSLFFLHFGFKVREDRVRQDVGERVHEVGVHCERGVSLW